MNSRYVIFCRRSSLWYIGLTGYLEVKGILDESESYRSRWARIVCSRIGRWISAFLISYASQPIRTKACRCLPSRKKVSFRTFVQRRNPLGSTDSLAALKNWYVTCRFCTKPILSSDRVDALIHVISCQMSTYKFAFC